MKHHCRAMEGGGNDFGYGLDFQQAYCENNVVEFALVGSGHASKELPAGKSILLWLRSHDVSARRSDQSGT